MDFKDIKLRLGGYVAYCNTMLGTNLNFVRNKRFNQFEIIKRGKKGEIGKMIMVIETGQIRQKITIRCTNAHEYYIELCDICNQEITVKFGEMVIVINDDKKLFELLESLEKIGFFGNVKSI